MRPNHKGDIALMDEVPLNFVVDYTGAVTEKARTEREEEVKKKEPWHTRHQTWQLNPPGTIQLD